MLIGILISPLIFCLVFLLIPDKFRKALTLLYALVSIVGIYCIAQQLFGQSDKILSESYHYTSSINSSLLLALDGIGYIPLLLTQLLVPVIVWVFLSEPRFKNTGIGALCALMHFGLNGDFLAADALVFYVFWEVTLIPIFFICLLFGEGDSIKISLKFFLYTFVGSLFMLLSFIYLYQHSENGSFNIANIYSVPLESMQRTWVLAGIFIAFAVKIPLFGFHNWQANSYATAPTGGSMLLSGLMLKMGIYGLIRWLFPLFGGDLSIDFQKIALLLSIIGVIYGGIIAIQQTDLKKIIAYSSLSHVGLIAAGIFTFTHSGWQGSMIQIFVHGMNIVGLFYISHIIEKNYGSRNLKDLGGIASSNSVFAIYAMILFLGSTGLPLTNGFPGEFLLLKSIFSYQLLYAAIAGTTVIWCAVYMLRMYQFSFFGEMSDIVRSKPLKLDLTEHFILGFLVLQVIIIGLFPQLILNCSEQAVSNYLLMK